MTLCPDDEALGELLEGRVSEGVRAAMLEHVESCGDCQSVLAAAATDGEVTRPLRAGDEIGRYRVVELLGAGAMGAVYRAQDLALGRDVALKVVRPGLGDSSAAALRSRLRAEAKALARMSSPHVVTIYEVGASGALGEVFLAMELVDGPSLRSWVAESPRSQREILGAFAQAARGLAAAHDAGVVHRDFKPDNVFIGGDGRVRVGDFGLARVGVVAEAGLGFLAGTVGASVVTRTFAGTPAYMAPELKSGVAASAASDQWAFCFALAEALLGKRPERGRLPSDLPADVRRLLQRGLEDDPTARHASIHDVALALERLSAPRAKRAPILAAAALAAVTLGGGAALAVARLDESARCRATAAASSRLWTDARREKTYAAFLRVGEGRAAATLAVVDQKLGAWSARWQREREAACEPAAQARATCLELQRRRVEATADLLAEADRKTMDEAVPAAHRLPAPESCLATAARVDDPRERSSEAIAMRQRIEDAIAQQSLARFETARDIAAEVAARAEQTGLRGVQQEALIAAGTARMDVNEPAESSRDLRAASAIALSRGDEPGFARALVLLGDLETRTGDQEAHAITVELASSVIAHLGGDASMEADLARVRCRMGWKRGHGYDVGTRDCEDARRRFVALGGEEHPHVAIVENELGLLAFLSGRYEDALAHFRRFEAKIVARLGDDVSDVDVSRVNVAETLCRIGRLDESESVARRVLERHADWATAWDVVALVRRRRGDTAGALDAYRRTAEVAQRAGAADECTARISITEILLDAKLDADAQAALAVADQSCNGRTLPESEARLGFARARVVATKDRAAGLRLAQKALEVIQQAKPSPGSTQGEVSAAIVAWLSR